MRVCLLLVTTLACNPPIVDDEEPPPIPVRPEPRMMSGLLDTCVLVDGDLECRGREIVTDPGGVFADADAARYFLCGVRTDGEVSCWDELGGSSVPDTPEGRFSRVAAGDDFACAMHPDGQLKCWGDIADPPGGRFADLRAG